MTLFFCAIRAYTKREKRPQSHLPLKKGMLRVADRIKKWGTMATGMLDLSKGGMLSTAGKLAAGGALLTLGIGALATTRSARAKAREDFNAEVTGLIKVLREELEKAKELQKTLDSRCEELGAKPCGIEPSAAAVDPSGESAGLKRALGGVHERIGDLDNDVSLLRDEVLATVSTVTGLRDDLGKLRRDHDSNLRNIKTDMKNADERLSQYQKTNSESLKDLDLDMQKRIKSIGEMISTVFSRTSAVNEQAISKVEGLEESLRTAMTAAASRDMESRLLEQISEMETRVKEYMEGIDRRSEGNLVTTQTVLADMREMDNVNNMRIAAMEETVKQLESELSKTGTNSFGSSTRLLPTLLSALGAVSSGGREKIAAKIVDVLVAQAALHRSAGPRVHALYTE